MNEAKKCSIAGIFFILDLNAHAELERYLNRVSEIYADTPDGEEIVNDIEARIAELILSKQDNTRAVNLYLINSILTQLGSPDDISSESDSGNSSKSKPPRIPRRLYRDTKNAKIGGVFSGFARYFDIDPTWLRIIAVTIVVVSYIPIFRFILLNSFLNGLSWAVVIGYLIMWFVVPVAHSARQRLEMEGENITASSIRDKANRTNEYNIDARSAIGSVIVILGQIAIIFLKVIAGIIALSFSLTIVVGVAMIYITVSNPELISERFFTVTDAIQLSIVAGGSLSVLLLAIFTYLLAILIVGDRVKRHYTLLGFLIWILALVGISASIVHGINRDDSLHLGVGNRFWGISIEKSVTTSTDQINSLLFDQNEAIKQQHDLINERQELVDQLNSLKAERDSITNQLKTETSPKDSIQ